jgi:nickel transport protein
VRALIITFSSILILLLAPSAFAHEWWLERGDDGYHLQLGHAFGDHDGERTVEYDPARVGDIHCLGPDGHVADFAVERSWPLRIAGECPALAVVVDGGIWSRTIEGLRNLPPDELEGVLESWRVRDTAKRLDAWTPALARPITGALEIVPLEDPAGADALRLRITLDGEPVAGVAVRQAGVFAGTSSDDGVVQVPVDRTGQTFVDARHSAPRDDGGADATRYTATLLVDPGP